MLPKNKKLKYAFFAALLALAAVIGKLAFFPSRPAPIYLTAPATVGDLQDTVLASGVVKAYKQVSVGAQASGQIKALRVALGDTVKQGQAIAEIDSMTQQNALRAAQADLANFRAQLRAAQATTRQAELAFARQQTMFRQDASSREDYELAEAAMNSGRANVAALSAQIDKSTIAVDTAKVNLNYTKIVAPMDGVVVAVVAQQGQTVNANQSTPTIIKLARMDTVTIKTQISEADVTKVKAGQHVFFTILGEPERRYNTTLRAIEPAPDSILQDETASSSASSSTAASAIYYNGLLDMPNQDGKLRISMTAQVNIVLNEARGAILIPATALGKRDADGRYAVRVVGKDGRATPRKIRIGLNTTAGVQVLEGLAAGEKVVTGEALGDNAGAGARRGRPIRL
ncbi:MAG TPA: efflux RND transporter periplasmic adaptor subunit [Herbaspirillum sp.]|jgi:macrolide-specific efflux system membrane fusion protein